MKLLKRFLLFVFTTACIAGLICGIITAKANTEHRLTGKEEETVMLDDLYHGFRIM